jgi:outer membrane protein
MKKILSVTIGVGLLLISLTSFSQAQLKIGHVDFEKIMSALPETDTAKAILDKESKEFQAAYEELTVAYNQLYDEYQKGLSSYTAIAKKTKEDELLDKQKRMSEFEQNATTTLQNRNAELVKPIIDKINKAIDKVATENGFTYILDTSKGAVVFTSKDSQNITDMVIKII